VFDHRRTLNCVDLALPRAYTSQTRGKLMEVLVELTLLRHLRLRNVDKPLPFEHLAPTCFKAQQLTSLDIEGLALPGANWSLSGLARLPSSLETLILRAPVGQSSSLERLLTLLAPTLCQFALHAPPPSVCSVAIATNDDGDWTTAPWCGKAIFAMLWKIGLHRVRGGAGLVDAIDDAAVEGRLPRFRIIELTEADDELLAAVETVHWPGLDG
jgi:hypothetical protein